MLGRQGDLGVDLAGVIDELDFDSVLAEHFDDGSDLAAEQAVVGVIDEKGDDIEELECGRGRHWSAQST
jgi:hypothetical protein